MKRLTAAAIGFVVLTACTAVAWAQEELGGGDKNPVKPAAAPAARKATLEDKIKAVQSRVFVKKGRLEIAPAFNLGLNDAFNQKYAVSAGVGYHIVESFSIEAGFGYAFNAKTSNQTYLAKENLTIPDNGSLKYFFNLNAEWSPVYGKFAFFASKIVHFDLYITAGIGMAAVDYKGWSYDPDNQTTTAEDMSGLHLAPNIGVGERFFLTDWMTLRIELRDMIYNMTLKPRHYLITGADDKKETGSIDQIQNNLMFLIGLSFFIPPSFEYEL